MQSDVLIKALEIRSEPWHWLS